MHKLKRKLTVTCPVCNYSFSITEEEVCYTVGSKEFYVSCRNPAYTLLGSKKMHCNGYVPVNPLDFAGTADVSTTPANSTCDKTE